MFFYLTCFCLTLFFSALFAMGGVGSAIVLIPLFTLLGVGFHLSKAVGLFVNTVTTSTASVINYRASALDVKPLIFFLCFSTITAPVGAYAALHCHTMHIKLIFTLFLFFSAYSILSSKNNYIEQSGGGSWLMMPLGICVGFTAGLLGIGGGALIIPALFYMNFPPKKIAATVSFMIPFSTFIAFCSYVYLIDIDWILIGITTVAALIGGIIGTRIGHLYLKEVQMNKVLAAILCLVAMKMLYDLACISWIG